MLAFTELSLDGFRNNELVCSQMPNLKVTAVVATKYFHAHFQVINKQPNFYLGFQARTSSNSMYISSVVKCIVSS